MHGINKKLLQNCDCKTCGAETTWELRHRWEDNIKIDIRTRDFFK
jgi:hypothetical protein